MGGLTALALVVVAYTLVASRLDRWWITGPMVFVAAGVILGPGGLDVLPLSLTDETVLTITELTLALLLFADASTVRLRDVEGDTGLPRRLLFVGLPLTIAAGALVAYLVFPEVGWAAAALLATILAPTDAALGLAVVSNAAVPVRIRRALNVESGLNSIHRSPTPGDDAFGLDAAPRRAGECVAGPDLAAVCWSRLVPGSTRSG
jgi:sodium/hydrogen antiporter